METLMRSLLGRDQEFVMEKLQYLMRSEEIVETQKEEIENMKTDLERFKEENYYIKNKLDYKRDIIEDMESELEKFEKEGKEKDDLLGYQKNVIVNKDRMISTVNEIRQENEEKCSKLENELSIQNTVMNELKLELELKNGYINQQAEVQNLVDDIEHLKMTNEEKEYEIKTISKENESLRFQLANLNSKTEESLCLDEALELNLKRKFKCKKCDEEFACDGYLQSHMENEHERIDKILQMKLKLREVENLISDQKLDLVIKMSNLKERESAGKQTCRCRGLCAILHTKHGWSLTKSDKILKMVEEKGIHLLSRK